MTGDERFVEGVDDQMGGGASDPPNGESEALADERLTDDRFTDDPAARTHGDDLDDDLEGYDDDFLEEDDEDPLNDEDDDLRDDDEDRDRDDEDAIATAGGDDLEGEAEETEFATVATGADIDEAKRTALAQLRKIVPWVTDADVEYEVVEEGARGGFFGRGRKGAQVEARVRPAAQPADADLEPLAEDLREFLGEVVARMGLHAHIEVHEDGEAVVADLSGADLGILIGRHGQTIDALQYICAIAVNRRRKSRRRVVVDAEGYRDRRASSLHSMADRVAQRVARERESIMLKPMSAAERKVIHLHLKDDPKVETSSEGQEPNRAVVIAPRSSR